MTFPTTAVLRIDPQRLRRCVAAAGAAVLVSTLSAPVGATRTADAAAGLQRVIVRSSTAAAAASAVRRAGGSVLRVLGVVDGVAAEVPVTALAELRRGTTVTPDARGHLTSIDPVLGYDAAADMGSSYSTTRIANVQAAWKAGYTGKGIDVALIDSGVADVAGLRSGNVVNGPDLSFESQDPELAHRDTYGHGTHMAGIIAGRDAAARSYADPALFTGVAPDARLVNIKVAAADGSVDVSQVIAAIGWATEHARDPGYNIRVINLAFGTDSQQPYTLDPLAYAAETAWRNGIVVVVAGGNDGTDRLSLSDPAIHPMILAVGGEDPMGTVSTGDDTVPAFASHGTNTRHVDVVAPAVHVLSLRCPGCTIDLQNPAGRVGSRFLRGSGTSQATAAVAGAAAIVLQRYPKMTPDHVKKLLMTTATGFPGASALFRGSGALNVGKAVSTGAPTVVSPPASSTGGGSLDAARGTARLAIDGIELQGEVDIRGSVWNGATWAPKALGRTSWMGGDWNGAAWTGVGWTDPTWLGGGWAGAAWSGSDWAGHSWTGHSWTGHSWTASGWTGGEWTGHSWTGNSWTSSIWAGASWN